MAIYHMRVKVMSRSKGQSAVAGAAYRQGGGHSALHAAAYRSGEQLTDERTGRTYDYSRKQHVEHSEIITPDGAPAWMHDRQTLWGAVERGEKRKDAQLSREIEITLPRELSPEKCVTLVRAFARDQLVSRGMVADFAIHRPIASDGGSQPHAHIMLTMRQITPDGFGMKAREWNDRKLHNQLRAEWANYANQALKDAGIRSRIDHRSYADRDSDRAPQPNLPQLAFSNRVKELTSPVRERAQKGAEIRHYNSIRAQARAISNMDPYQRRAALNAHYGRQQRVDLGHDIARRKRRIEPFHDRGPGIDV